LDDEDLINGIEFIKLPQTDSNNFLFKQYCDKIKTNVNLFIFVTDPMSITDVMSFSLIEKIISRINLK
jgi:hypothetical protein